MIELFTSPDFLLSCALAVLLMVVIGVAWRLDSRLKTVRDSTGELHQLIQSLNGATDRAHQAIAQLSAAAREHKGSLEASVTKARDLSDELSLITQSAESLANRLTNSAPANPLKDASKMAPQEQPTQREEDNPRELLRQALAGVR